MVDVIFLFETLVDSNKIEELRVYLRFEGAFAINNVGRSGGLAVIWRTPNVVSLTNFPTISLMSWLISRAIPLGD